MKTRVGIVGAGLIAQLMHISYIKEIEKYQLVALCDANESLAQTVGKTFCISKIYSDEEKMLSKENLDAVIVCVQNEFHDQVSIKALEAGCHVLVEKPLTLSIEAADHMIRAASKAGRILMVAYMKRYDPGYKIGAAMMKEAKDDIFLIRSHDFANGLGVKSPHEIFASIGEGIKREKVPPEILEESRKRREELFAQQLDKYTEEEVNAWEWLLMLASHDMTVLRGAFGDPKEILAATIIPGVPSELPLETSYTTKVLALLDYGTAKCIYGMGGTQRTWFDEELVAYGNKETISIKFPYPWIKNQPTTVSRTRIKDGGFEESNLTFSYRESFKMEHLHFIDCIEKGLEPITSGKEGKRDLEISFDILEKARKKD